MLYYNALSSLPFLLLVVMATGEAGQLAGAYAAAVGRSGAATLWGTLAACSLMVGSGGAVLGWQNTAQQQRPLVVTGGGSVPDRPWWVTDVQCWVSEVPVVQRWASQAMFHNNAGILRA